MFAAIGVCDPGGPIGQVGGMLAQASQNRQTLLAVPDLIFDRIQLPGQLFAVGLVGYGCQGVYGVAVRRVLGEHAP